MNVKTESAHQGEFENWSQATGELARKVALAGVGLSVIIGEQGQKAYHSALERGKKWSEGTGGAFDSLVQKGEAYEPRGREQLRSISERIGKMTAEVTSGVARPFRGIRDSFQGAVNRSEQAMDRKVQDALERTGFPTREELNKLMNRLDQLSERLATLQKQAEGSRGSGETGK